MRNQDLRDLTRAKRLFSYEVAEAMGLSRSAYFDLLRKKDLPEKDREKILAAIDEAARRREQEIFATSK